MLAVELALSLLLLAGCFGGEQRVYAVFGEDIAGQTRRTEEGLAFEGERLELLPGVYEVRVQTNLEEDASFFFQMKEEGASYRALRSNGNTVLPHQGDASLRVYVTDRVQSAYVYCEFIGTGTESLALLEVCRTSLGNRVLLLTALAVFGLLDFLLLFRRRILAGSVTKKQQVVFWSLTAVTVLACFPYLTDYFSIGDDMLFHLSRIAFLQDTLQEGTALPVRIQSTWLCGHGYAVSLFYGELFLLFPALLYMAGFSIMAAYKIFVVAVTAATAAIAYFSFRKCVKEEYAALAGSICYLLVPYRLYNIYTRAAAGEYLAMAFLPLLCCGMYLLYTREADSKEYRRYKWYIVWGMSAILQSHLITTEMAVFFMALVCLISWKKTFRKQTFFQLLEAVGLVLALNAWFWIPMLYMLQADQYQLTQIVQITDQGFGAYLSGYLQFLPNIGKRPIVMGNYEPVQLGAGTAMLLLLLGLWRLRSRRKNRACGILVLFCLTALLLGSHYLPWEDMVKIPILGTFLGSIQFPFRWLSPASAFAAMLMALFCGEVLERGGAALRAGMAVCLAVTVFSAVYHVNSIAFESSASFLYNPENMGTGAVGNGEYLFLETEPEELRYHAPVADEGLNWGDYGKNGTNIELWVQNDTGETLALELPLLGYQGYCVRAAETVSSGAGLPYIAEDRGEHGDLRIAVPAGYAGKLKISYEGLPLFRAAEGISLISLLALAVWSLLRYCKKGPRVL